MKLITVKISNKKLLTVFMCVMVCFLIFLEFLSVNAQSGSEKINDNASRVDFIRGLGLEPYEESVEVKQVIIPENFNDVYLKYNEIQKQAGYDLSKYCGETATVYRYKISKLNDKEAYVNLMILDDKIIGGDISSIELNGFMLPLKEIE